MKDALTYRVSAEGEQEFNKAVASAKKWIGSNINGPLKLGFSITLKASTVDGESVQGVMATDPLDLNGGEEKPRRGRKKAEAFEAME